MQLALQVVGVVLVVTVVLGLTGFLIDRSAARHEPGEDGIR
jgi:hypothetical protein